MVDGMWQNKTKGKLFIFLVFNSKKATRGWLFILKVN